jgi:hypothetical protein
MSKTIRQQRKKPGPPSRGGKSPLIGLRIDALTLRKLDTWAKARKMSRSQAIKAAIDQLLSSPE